MEYDKPRQTFEERCSIFGAVSGGRFGSAVVFLGDLDGDGFGEFAVGSPFEDNDRGVVRIYFGKERLESILGKIL